MFLESFTWAEDLMSTCLGKNYGLSSIMKILLIQKSVAPRDKLLLIAVLGHVSGRSLKRKDKKTRTHHEPCGTWNLFIILFMVATNSFSDQTYERIDIAITYWCISR